LRYCYQTQQYFHIVFKEDGIDLRFRGDDQFYKKFCNKNAGTIGYMILCVGKMEKSVQQLRFFHGPMIDAFVRLTGDTDRNRLKKYLKENFLDRDEPDVVPSLADISLRRMAAFLQRVGDNLKDEGGYLDEYEHREYQQVIDI
jgi:hypothetical protein